MKRALSTLVLTGALAAGSLAVGIVPAGAARQAYTCTITYEGTTYTFTTRNEKVVAAVQENGGTCTPTVA